MVLSGYKHVALQCVPSITADSPQKQSILADVSRGILRSACRSLHCLLVSALPDAVAGEATIVATCNRTGAAFPTAFTVSLQASAGARTPCPNTADQTTTVTMMCCVGGAAYVKGGKPSCMTSRGCSNPGFINSGAVNGSYAVIAGFNRTCGGGASAGSLQLQCSNTTTNSSRVVLKPFTATSTGTTRQFFYVGCSAPKGANNCSALAGFGAPNNCSVPIMSSCGGELRAPSSTVNLPCSCTRVQWSIASVPTAPASMAVDRVNGVCPV